ncbi:hypothetical protein, partial [Xanthomonas translucens]|uniref:hypothetical protein n=1 Tax=Xanthomonas campestris pv. translucens TaxID=343 RepID=UPI001E2F33D2
PAVWPGTPTLPSFWRSNAIEGECVDAIDACALRLRQPIAEIARFAALKKLQKTLAHTGRHR